MNSYVAFLRHDQIASGDLLTVALETKHHLEATEGPMPLIFEEATGKQIDIDVRGSRADLEQRFAPGETAAESLPAKSGKRGRPRLGVTGREVTLLPTHWRWLDGQRGGASAALRRLVDKARRENRQTDRVRESQDRTYRFISAIAGDLAGFEEATRALYSGDSQRFTAETERWPADVRATAIRFSLDAFASTPED